MRRQTLQELPARETTDLQVGKEATRRHIIFWSPVASKLSDSPAEDKPEGSDKSGLFAGAHG